MSCLTIVCTKGAPQPQQLFELPRVVKDGHWESRRCRLLRSPTVLLRARCSRWWCQRRQGRRRKQTPSHFQINASLLSSPDRLHTAVTHPAQRAPYANMNGTASISKGCTAGSSVSQEHRQRWDVGTKTLESYSWRGAKTPGAPQPDGRVLGSKKCRLESGRMSLRQQTGTFPLRSGNTGHKFVVAHAIYRIPQTRRGQCRGGRNGLLED